MIHACFRKFFSVLIVGSLLTSVSPGFVAPLGAAETNGQVEAAAQIDSALANEILRNYLQLREQIHDAQTSIERTRLEAERAVTRNAEVLAEQMKQMQESMDSQRIRDLEAMQATTRFMLIVLSVFAAVGFIGIVLTAYFQWRAVTRLAQFTSSWSEPRHSTGLLPIPSEPALSESQLPNAEAVQSANHRVVDLLARLENRIAELEDTAHGPVHEQSGMNGNGPVPSLANSVATVTGTSPTADHGFLINDLVEKGQRLLDEGKSEEAIACFDEVLATDPSHTDALVKKGTALEKLRKLHEAIECYNRAIAIDQNMTIAYLYKGGVYNRMERFGEAVECYEQALKTQEKRG